MKLFVKDKSFYKTFFVLATSIALQNLIVYSVNLADNLMLGTYSELSLSAAALANQIQFFLQMLVIGIGSGVMVISSQYWGKKDFEPIKKILGIGVWLSIVIALAMFFLVFFFSREVLLLLTNEEAIIEECQIYLSIICYSYIFFAITNILIAFLRSIEIVKVGFIVSGFTFLINVSLNYLFIYGNLGAPELGIKGAAIATLVARIFEFICIFTFTLLFNKRVKVKLKSVFGFDKSYVSYFIRTSLPMATGDAMWGVAMTVQTAILGHLGAQAIAANSIALVIFQVITVLCFGSANASAVIIGKTIGQDKYELAINYTKTLQILYLIIGLSAGILLFLFKDLILSLYTITPETKELASQFTTVLAFLMVFTTYDTAVIIGILRGGGSSKFALYLDILSMWLISIPVSLLTAFVFHAPPLIVFICLRLNQFANCIVGYLKINKGNWIKKLTI